jgi:type IV pilus assembly protein PilZ
VIEKRKFPRKPVDLSAAVFVAGRSEALRGRLRDLSVGGAFIFLPTSLPFGANVEVQIDFPPPSGPMTLPAVVRWSNGDGVGVQFGLLGARETHAIATVLARK